MKRNKQLKRKGQVKDRGMVKWHGLILPEHSTLLREWYEEDQYEEKPTLEDYELS